MCKRQGIIELEYNLLKEAPSEYESFSNLGIGASLKIKKITSTY